MHIVYRQMWISTYVRTYTCTYVFMALVHCFTPQQAFGVFGLCQIYAFVEYVRSKLTARQFEILFKTIVALLVVAGGTAGGILTITGKISPWTGRFYSLLDPSYAKNNIPIIASVSEHQPTSWSSFYFDLQLLVFMFPVGLYVCFSKLTDANVFIILYGITSIYFAGVMVRLMLVLAPVMCILSGIGVSSLFNTYMKVCAHTYVCMYVGVCMRT